MEKLKNSQKAHRYNLCETVWFKSFHTSRDLVKNTVYSGIIRTMQPDSNTDQFYYKIEVIGIENKKKKYVFKLDKNLYKTEDECRNSNKKHKHGSSKDN